MTLPVSIITTYLSLYEKSVWLSGRVSGLTKDPLNNADLDRKIGHVDKRFLLAARRFMLLQPVSWKRENHLLPGYLVSKEYAALNLDYYINCYRACFQLMMLKALNPDYMFTADQQYIIDQFAASTAINFRSYLDETLSLYDRQPFAA